MNEDFRDHEAIIYPKRAKGVPDVGPDVIMVMIPSEIQYLVRLSGAKMLPFNTLGSYGVYEANGEGATFTLAGPFFGAPHAVMGMERLIVQGGRRIWVFGWCGSLHPECCIGDLVIPTRGISEEGTSQHYPILPKAPESDPALVRVLESSLSGEGLAYAKGDVWTTDAVYRETRDKVRAYQEKGVLAVEMEMSALMTVAVYRSVSLAGLLVISDELLGLKWRPGFSDPLFREKSRAAGRMLLTLVKALAGKTQTLTGSGPSLPGLSEYR